MTNSDSNNMTFTGKNLLPYQKLNRTCGFGTAPADKLKIEILIKILTSATSNKDNKVNKLVTVFAVTSCTKTVSYTHLTLPTICSV